MITVRDLGRQSNSGKWLLRGISLEMRGGDRIAVVGPSGSGKSLLCRAIALLDTWEEGELRFHAEPVADAAIPSYRAAVMYVTQRPSLHEGTVEENLKSVFSLRVHALKRWDAAFATEALERLGFSSSFLSRSQRELSGGESQAVSLVRALQLNPEVLLLDEPTSAMDPERVLAAETLVKDWQAKQPDTRAYLWVTHHEAQPSRIATRTLKVVEGTLRT